MLDISIKIENDGISQALATLQAKLKNLSPVMRQIAGIMRGAVEDNFAAQGRPAWKPSGRALKHGGKTLQDTGRLAKSITSRNTATEAIVGTNVVYAAIHQFGGTITQPPHTQTLAFKNKGGFLSHKAAMKRKTAINVAFANYGARTFQMPARPFLSLTDMDMANVTAAIQQYLTQ